MATLVCFHAHPDDEAIATAGTMLLASQAGHRVVLVMATRGEHGEVADGELRPGEVLWERRVVETERSAAVLGVDALHFLGYVDSGMVGEATNGAPGSFWSADVEIAASKLAAILRIEGADILTVYDHHGSYGHPDHIQVHRVGHRAAQLAGVGRVFEATINRDHVLRQREMWADAIEDAPDAADVADDPTFGIAEELITHAVDVTSVLREKRRAMRAHSSQITDTSFFATMPDEVFASAFGVEWYIEPGRNRNGGPFERDLFDGLDAARIRV